VHRVWYLVVVLPFGGLVYFFAVKLRDFNIRPGPAPEPLPVELSVLEAEVEASPSFQNRVRLAWALFERERPERAEALFTLALRTHPNDKEALYGLGLCQLERGKNTDAVATLTGLAERSLAYESYQAALALAEALFRTGETDKLIDLLRAVIRHSGELAHRLLLARYQLRVRDRAEAQATLRTALDAFEAQPDFVRQRNGALATEARRLLRTLEEHAH
jgi:tetratricopeptide (TPR) repeat protein